MNETSIMNSMKQLPAIAFTLLLAAACTAENEEATLGAVPLTFSTSVDAQTRAATELTTDNLTSVGVFACFTQGNFDAGTATPNFMYNQELKKDAAAWTYSPLKYWPNNENDKISFFAYAPRNAAGVTLCGNTNKGFPYIDYTVPTAEADQIDLLASTPLMNCTKGNTSAVNLTMGHALTKVTIYAKSSDLSAGKVVNGLSVTAPKSGRLAYKANGFSWSSSADKSTYAATNIDVTIATTTADETVLLGTFYLIPDRVNSSLNITYTVTGSISDNVNPPTDKPVITGQAFPDTYDWLPGASIVYTVNIARTGMQIVAESSSMEWTNSTVKDIEYFEADDLKPCDYYYSDGSWSDGGLRMIDHSNGQIVWENLLPAPNLTNPQTGATRTCIGIIYKIGAGEGDSTNDYNGKLAAIHGYVLSVYCKDRDVTYGPNEDAGTSQSSTDYRGYYNTTKMIAKAESHGGLSPDTEEGYPVAYYATTVCESLYPAPGNTSGWYLPSVGQLQEAYNNRTVIEANFNKIINGNGNTLSDYIRTSSECSEIRFAYVLDDGYPSSAYGKDASWYKAYSSLTF